MRLPQHLRPRLRQQAGARLSGRREGEAGRGGGAGPGLSLPGLAPERQRLSWAARHGLRPAPESSTMKISSQIGPADRCARWNMSVSRPAVVTNEKGSVRFACAAQRRIASKTKAGRRDGCPNWAPRPFERAAASLRMLWIRYQIGRARHCPALARDGLKSKDRALFS